MRISDWSSDVCSSDLLEQANAMLRVLHARVFGIMVRRSQPIWAGVLAGEPLLPPPPENLLEQDIEPEFISALQQAQRAQQLQGNERFASFAGAMAQFLGKPPEKFDADQAKTGRASCRDRVCQYV